MSLSNGSSNDLDQKITGRVIIGMDSPGPDEMTVQEIEGKRKLMWDENVDQEYMDRVKTRAQNVAKDIIAKAMTEAEQIKAEAHSKGYEEGMVQARQVSEQHAEQLTQSFDALMTNLSAQGQNVWGTRRDDLVRLVHMVIEKTLAVEMETRRSEILLTLMNEAVDKLESMRSLVIRCSPADEALAGELMAAVQERNPGLKQWKIQPDASIQAGGVLVESDESRVDNTIDTRWSVVEPIISQLSLTNSEQGE